MKSNYITHLGLPIATIQFYFFEKDIELVLFRPFAMFDATPTTVQSVDSQLDNVPLSPSLVCKYHQVREQIEHPNVVHFSNSPRTTEKRKLCVSAKRVVKRIKLLSEKLSLSFDEDFGDIGGMSWDTFTDMKLDFRTAQGQCIKKKFNISDVQSARKLHTSFGTLKNILNNLCKQPPLPSLPEPLRERLCAVGLGGWVRRKMRVQGRGIYSQHLWQNDTDLISTEPFDDIPSHFVVVYSEKTPVAETTIKQSSESMTKDVDPQPDKAFLQRVAKMEATFKKHTQHMYAFDLRSLIKMMSHTKSNFRNPYTNQPFNRTFIKLVIQRTKQLTKLGYSTTSEWDNTPTPPTPPSTSITSTGAMVDDANLTPEMIQQKLVYLVGDLNTLGYAVTVDMFRELSNEQTVKWYRETEDIMRVRLRLTPQQQNEIVPGSNGRLFTHTSTISSTIWSVYHSPLQLRWHVLTVMHKLCTSAYDRHQRETGANYVMMGLTLCSEVFRDAFPYLAYGVGATEVTN